MVTVVLVLIAWIVLPLPLAMLLGPAFRGPEIAPRRGRSGRASTA